MINDDWFSQCILSISNIQRYVQYEEKLISLIKEVQMNGELVSLPELANSFFYKFSPSVINSILNTKMKEKDDLFRINNVLGEYLMCIPKLLFGNYHKAIKAILKIVNSHDSFLYTLTKEFRFTSTQYVSPLFEKNMGILTNSSFIQAFYEFYSLKKPFDPNFSLDIVTTISQFRKQWDPEYLELFRISFLGQFSSYITSLLGKHDRAINEKEILSIFTMIKTLFPNDDIRKPIIEESEFEFCIDLLESGILPKQYSAMQVFMSYGTLPTNMSKTLISRGLIDQLLQNIHPDIVAGFSWLFIRIAKEGLITFEHITNFWLATISQHPSALESFFAEWIHILSSLSRSFFDDFWIVLTNSPLLSSQLSFLKKISHLANDEQLMLMFNKIFQTNRIDWKNLDLDFTNTFNYLLPTNQDHLNELLEICCEHYTDSSKQTLCLSCLSCLFYKLSINNANRILGLLFCNNFFSDGPVILYLDLINKILLRYPDSIYVIEEDNLTTNIVFIVNDNSRIIYDYLEKTDYNLHFLKTLYKKLYITLINDKIHIQLFLLLFQKTNNIVISDDNMIFPKRDNPDLEGLFGIEELWKSLSKFSSDDLSLFLANLYSKCLHYSIDFFISKCFQEPISEGRIKALLLLVDKIESFIDHSSMGFHISRLNDNYKNIHVFIKGAIECCLLIPKTTDVLILKRIISNITSVNSNSLYFSNNDEIKNSKSLNLENGTVLEIRSYNKDFPKTMLLPSCRIHDLEYQNVLYHLLINENTNINELSLKLLYYLPPSQTEIDLLKCDTTDWTNIFSPRNISLLKYRLHILGNLLLTDYIWFFYLSGAINAFFDVLVFGEITNDIFSLVMRIVLLSFKDDKSSNFVVIRNKFWSSIAINEISNFFASINSIAFRDDNEYIDFLRVLELFVLHSSSNVFLEESSLLLINKMVFHNNEYVRSLICSIILKLDSISKRSIIRHLVSVSDNEFCSEFFDMIISTKSFDLDFVELIVQLLIRSICLDEKENHLFQAKSLSKEFVCNSIILLKNQHDLIPNSYDAKIFDCIVKGFLFPVYKAYEPTKDVFILLMRIIRRDNDSLTRLKSIMLNAHQNIDLNKQEYNNFHYPQTYKGIRNLGSTCYLNSVLQLLYNNSVFFHDLLSTKDESNQLLIQMQSLFLKMRFFPVKNLEIKEIITYLPNPDNEPFMINKQQDAAEFLLNLLDKLGDITPSIIRSFKGEILNETISTSSDFRSITTDFFNVFGVTVKGFDNLNDSLRSFLIPDQFKGNNQYYAEGIGKIDAEMNHYITNPPRCLLLQLKRFYYDIETNQHMKIQTEFAFENEIDIGFLVSHPKMDYKYELKGIIAHRGFAQAGHYVCYSRINEEWFLFNDNTVEKCENINFIEKLFGRNHIGTNQANPLTAYILLYEKIEPGNKLEEINEEVINSFLPQLQSIFKFATITNPLYCTTLLNIYEHNGSMIDLFIFFSKCMLKVQDQNLIKEFQRVINHGVEIDQSFTGFIVSQYESHVKVLLVDGSKEMRQCYVDILCHCMQSITYETCSSLIHFLSDQIPNIAQYWSNFDEFFVPFLQSISLLGMNEKLFLPIFFSFLEDTIPNFELENKKKNIYRTINLNSVFKLLIVLLSSADTRKEYHNRVFNPCFINRWFDSNSHSSSLSQLLRSYISDSSTLAIEFFHFFEQYADDLSAMQISGYLSVVLFSPISEKDKQIICILNYIGQKSQVFILDFIIAFSEKLKQLKLDFISYFFNLSVVFIDNWLLSNSSDLRRAMYIFIKRIFSNYAPDSSYCRRLLELLISKTPQVIKFCLQSKNEWVFSLNPKPLVESFPSDMFFRITAWITNRATLSSLLAENSKTLVDGMNDLKKLKISKNQPRSDLLNLIYLCIDYKEMFFKHVTVSSFLNSFSDMSNEFISNSCNVKDSLSLLCFVPSGNMNLISQSSIFQTIVFAFLLNEMEESQQFVLFIIRNLTFDTVISISRVLWANDSIRSITNTSKSPLITLTLFILRTYPIASTLFHDKNLNSLTLQYFKQVLIKNRVYSSELISVIREYSESYYVYNYGKKNWFKKNMVDPLISFWVKNESFLSEMVSLLSSKPLPESFSSEVCSLLKTVVSLSDKSHKYLFELVSKNQNLILNYCSISNINDIDSLFLSIYHNINTELQSLYIPMLDSAFQQFEPSQGLSFPGIQSILMKYKNVN